MIILTLACLFLRFVTAQDPNDISQIMSMVIRFTGPLAAFSGVITEPGIAHIKVYTMKHTSPKDYQVIPQEIRLEFNIPNACWVVQSVLDIDPWKEIPAQPAPEKINAFTLFVRFAERLIGIWNDPKVSGSQYSSLAQNLMHPTDFYVHDGDGYSDRMKYLLSRFPIRRISGFGARHFRCMYPFVSVLKFEIDFNFDEVDGIYYAWWEVMFKKKKSDVSGKVDRALIHWKRLDGREFKIVSFQRSEEIMPDAGRLIRN